MTGDAAAAVPDAAVTAADAWARSHDCRDIRFCAATPLDAFSAGWEAGAAQAAAAERARLAAVIREFYGEPVGTAIAHALEAGQL